MSFLAKLAQLTSLLSSMAKFPAWLLRAIQIGNHVSDTYEQNAQTDNYTVHGVALTAAVTAILEGLNMTGTVTLNQELIAWVATAVGATGTQVYPYIRHWLDEREAKRKAAEEQKRAAEQAMFANWDAKVHDTTKAEIEKANAQPVIETAPPDDEMISAWQGESTRWRPPSGCCLTVKQARDNQDALAVLVGSRVYTFRTKAWTEADPSILQQFNV